MAVFGCGAHFHAEEDAPGEFVEPAEAAKWVDEASCIAVDVREDFEIAERGPLPGAFQLSSGAIMFAKPDLDKKLECLRRNSKPIVCYTDKGVEKSRCGVVCQWLVDKGFPAERLRRLKGGRDAWHAEGYPTCVYGDEMWQLANQAQLSGSPLGRSLRWQVIGGADKGGILVREGAALTSPACEERLKTGSILEQVQLKGERLCYKLLEGDGPKTGWASIRLSEKELIVLHSLCPTERLLGSAVRIRGLQSDAGKALNGQEGFVHSFDEEKQRLVVKVYGSGEERALKVINLIPKA
ncbi:unnamed protein product [Symbiodinium natans]|uniref:Rhodanese domain-containing protein n=1 Tax=Symbiodinium natans TaxID=878477 RepID=A0A812UWI1_9DINO|nr:unnamed protein product [Symbiodinium natans]